MPVAVEILVSARDAVARREWRAAYELLHAAERDHGLAAAELPLYADVAYASGHLDVTLAVWERLHGERARAHDRMGAAEAAVRVAQHLVIDTALMAPTRAWLVRAESFLDGNDNAVFAWVAVVRTYERLLSGDLASARTWARTAIEVGSRHDPAAAAVGRVAEARGLVLEGDVRRGLAMLDEAAATMLAGGLPPIPAGMIWCELVCGAQGVAQWDLVEEWTVAYERWCSDGAHGSLGGRCRIHRAELLRMRGALADAEAEAVAACEELEPYLRRELGWPLTELAQIRLRRGDLDGAEETFRMAYELAWDPHPGFALVRLARGDLAGAATAIQDALDHPFEMPSKERPPTAELGRVPLLDAQVRIALAADDRKAARAAADELATIADRFASKGFAAMAALAIGRVLLAEGDSAGARRSVELAVRSWIEIDAPFETALARGVLARVHEAAGNLERARMERAAAEAILVRIGAPIAFLDDSPAIAVPTAPAATSHAADHANEFRRDGDTWLVVFDERSVRVRDLKGMRYLAHLIREGGRELHVLQLVAREVGGSATGVDLGTAGALLDPHAKDVYRRRLAEITEDLEDAQACNDLGRATRSEHERDFLVRELARAVGLGGRDRVAGSASERARVAATRAVRQAIERIREHHETLADHLDRKVKTGTYFCYEQDPRAPVAWVL